jgi:lysozyme
MLRRACSSAARAATIAAAGAVGCTAPAEEPLGRAESPAVVCADGEEIEGIDVSYYQGDIDWAAVRDDGIHFGVARVNDGDFIDPEFASNWSGMAAVGLVRGSYQFFHPGSDPIEQADTLIDRVGTLGPGDLPAVIDVEDTDGVDAATIVDSVRQWVDRVEAATGRTPIVYTGSYFWNDNVGSDEFVDHPLWIAHYTTQDCPNLPTAWGSWLMWQYTNMGEVEGILDVVDVNRFNGGSGALHDLASNGYRARVDAIDFPTSLGAGEIGRVSLSLTNLGGRTWGASTKLGTTEPRDRDSVFVADGWENARRIAAMPQEVAAGQSITLEFDIRAPTQAGEYVERFNLVEDGIAWFSDMPPGGGPSDDTIVLTISVTSEGLGQGGESALPPSNDDDDDDGDKGGCSTTGGSTPSGAYPWLLVAALLLRRRSARTSAAAC